jgi:hypothetical protein
MGLVADPEALGVAGMGTLCTPDDAKLAAFFGGPSVVEGSVRLALTLVEEKSPAQIGVDMSRSVSLAGVGPECPCVEVGSCAAIGVSKRGASLLLPEGSSVAALPACGACGCRCADADNHVAKVGGGPAAGGGACPDSATARLAAPILAR